MSELTDSRLPDSELEVMLVLWRHTEPVRTSRILQEVNESRSWTLSTLKALLARLAEKGFVEVTRQGRFTLYRALVPEADYRRRETQSLVQRYYQSSVKSLVATLVSEGGLSDEDLSELRQVIENAKEK